MDQFAFEGHWFGLEDRSFNKEPLNFEESEKNISLAYFGICR